MTRLILASLLTVSFASTALGMPDYYKSLLARLIAINTDTKNIEGLENMRTLLSREFERLGMSVRQRKAGSRRLLIAEGQSRAKVVLVGHLDTVFSMGETVKPFSEDAYSYYGDGIIDMKGGIILMLQILSEMPPKLRSQIKVILNDEEETGTMNLRDLLVEEARGLGPVLIFEPGQESGDVVSSQSGVAWFQLDVQGRAAHAGLEPQNGYNACVELSYKAVHLHNLSNYSTNLSVTVGTITGGTKPNVVCEKASAKVDMRFVTSTQYKDTTERIEAVANRNYLKSHIPGFTPVSTLQRLAYLPSLQPEYTKRLVGQVATISSSLGLKVGHRHVGYGSDGGILTEASRDVLVGLGPFGGGMHTKQEFMSKRSYRERLQLNKKLITSIIGD